MLILLAPMSEDYRPYYRAPIRYPLAVTCPGSQTVQLRKASACPRSSIRVTSRICRSEIIISRVNVLHIFSNVGRQWILRGLFRCRCVWRWRASIPSMFLLTFLRVSPCTFQWSVVSGRWLLKVRIWICAIRKRFTTLLSDKTKYTCIPAVGYGTSSVVQFVFVKFRKELSPGFL